MKTLELSLMQPEEMKKIARAFSSDVKIGILRLLGGRSLSVVELSERLKMPLSTVSTGIVHLEKAGLINCVWQKGIRGSMKLCSLKIDNIYIGMFGGLGNNIMQSIYLQMPIGHYMDCRIKPVCGLANSQHNIAFEDEPSSFFDKEHVTAQLLWFRQGYVEYRFSNIAIAHRTVDALELSFEACSEAPNYRNDWPSDITVWINGMELGTWTCPGDFGGRRGKYNPDWWPTASTQYGRLKHWRVDDNGSFLDEAPLSDVSLTQLKLKEQPYISVRIGIKPDSPNQGGINLFGEEFGDYSQAIVLRLDCDN